jgi:hypothetical protein
MQGIGEVTHQFDGGVIIGRPPDLENRNVPIARYRYISVPLGHAIPDSKSLPNPACLPANWPRKWFNVPPFQIADVFRAGINTKVTRSTKEASDLQDPRGAQ